MKIDTMRAVDRWAGIPLCFLVTLATRFFRRPDPPPPRRILFLELSEMGSTILADPAMRKAQSHFGAELYFLIFRGNADSLALLETVPKANIRTIREKNILTILFDTLSFLVWARRRKIDAVIDLELFSRYTALLSGLCGAAHRVGFYRFHNEGLYRGEMLTRRVGYNPHIHIAKNFIALVNALAGPPSERPQSKTLVTDAEITIPRLLPGEHEIAPVRARVAEAYPPFEPDRHRLVLINPNASELLPHRRWPAANYAALSRQILDRWPDTVLLITGSPGESEGAERLRALVGDARMINFTGRTRLVELPLLYAQAALMVSNDSGPGHFAAVSDMPTIVLFGPETPALYGPLGNALAITAGLACSPCVSAANHRRTACTDPVCMTAILPERVLGAVAKVLDGGTLAD